MTDRIAPMAFAQSSEPLPSRVLFAGDTVSPFTARLAGALLARGFDVSVLNGPRLVQAVREQYGKVVRNVAYEEVRLRGNARLPAVRRMESRLNRLRLHRVIRGERPDVLHVNNLYCGERLDRIAAIDPPPAPMLVSAFGTDVDDSVISKHPSYPPMREQLLARAELVTASSGPMVRRCRSFVSHRPERDFRLIHWYADRTQFNVETARRGRQRWRQRLGIGPHDRVVLSPRATAPNYQIDRVIRAFAGALAGGHCRAILVVVHRASGTAAQDAWLCDLRRLAAPLGANVRFVPQVPYTEVPELFGMADVAVSIPRADGAAATHFELLALGVPLIVADLDDYRGILEPYHNAIPVDATADEPVARAIRAVLTDRALREHLASGAIASAERLGTFDETVDAYVRAYHEVLVRARRRRSDPLGLGEMSYAGIGARETERPDMGRADRGGEYILSGEWFPSWEPMSGGEQEE